MSVRHYQILLFVLVVTQVLGFGLLWARLAPQQSEDAAALAVEGVAGEEVSLRILEELKAVREMRNSMSVASGVGAVELPQAQALRDMVRYVLEQELASVLANLPDRAVNAGAQPQVVDYTPEQIEAQEFAVVASSEILDEAIDSGEWTERHLVSLLPTLAGLSPTQREALAKKYFEAVSSGKLKVDGLPPPF